MSHPYSATRAEHHERAHKMLGRTGNKMARGGSAHHSDAKEDEALIRKAIGEHEDQEHSGKHSKLKFKDGGAVEGEHARQHLGKRARGGPTSKGGKGHVTNVIVAPQGGGAPPAGGMRPAMPPQAAPRPPMPAQRPAGPPPGAMPGGAPPGAPPMGMRPPGAMKRGGEVKHRAKRERGGGADCDEEDGGERRARGGHIQKMQEVGVPSESLMQSNRGGKVRHRDAGGSAGVPADPTQMNPAQLQRIASIRKQMAQAAQAKQAAAQGGGGMTPPMGGAQAARMMQAPGAMPTQKRGGEVHVKEHKRRARGGHVEMEAGGGGGQGRIEKMREYGSGRGFTPKKVPLHA